MSKGDTMRLGATLFVSVICGAVWYGLWVGPAGRSVGESRLLGILVTVAVAGMLLALQGGKDA